jgi:hypothetical protein
MNILRKDVFYDSAIEITEKQVVFGNFDRLKLFFMQNTHDIRNQHEKIYQQL